MAIDKAFIIIIIFCTKSLYCMKAWRASSSFPPLSYHLTLQYQNEFHLLNYKLGSITKQEMKQKLPVEELGYLSLI